jgi:peptidoglycan/xylan/chitin deacetylase (PgdA/CDA1 family)
MFYKILFFIIRYSGLPFIFREFFQKRKVTILLFHDLDVKSADKQFDYLKRKYNPISIDTFIKACNSKCAKYIPYKAIILTFDDGHKGNYNLLPLIEKYKIPVTIFLCSDIINTNRHFWFKYAYKSFQSDYYKRMTNKEKLKLLAIDGFEYMKEMEDSHALSKIQIEELRKSNFINLQAHTRYHPILPTCSFDEAEDEIIGSKKILETEYNLKINGFAYPNGDYCDRDIAICKKGDFKYAITVDFGYNNIDTDLFRLKRISVNDTQYLNEFIVKASGFWSYFKTRNGKQQAFGYWLKPLIN